MKMWVDGYGSLYTLDGLQACPLVDAHDIVDMLDMEIGESFLTFDDDMFTRVL